MKFRLEKIIGKNKLVFEQEVNSNTDFFKAVSFYSQLPSVCGNCKSQEIYPSFKVTKDGYEYSKIECYDCKHELSFGQYRNGNGSLFSKNVWTLPEFKQKDQSNTQEMSIF